MSAIPDVVVPQTAAAWSTDLEEARDLGTLATLQHITVRAAHGLQNLWLVFVQDGVEIAALRLGPNAGAITNVNLQSRSGETAGIEFTTALGAMRAKIEFHQPGSVRCTSSLLPVADTLISGWPRDLYVLGGQRGTVHTAQRGLRSGIVFASCNAPVPASLFYFQNFSSLTDYFRAARVAPADTVGGVWPELGYAPPSGDGCRLPKAREIVVSDAYVSFAPDAPTAEEAIAARYLDLLAEIYVLLERPATVYHDWPGRAAQALRDVSLSPACTYVRQNKRFLMPYVGDETKPPESMVQFTVAVNTGEYDRWRGEPSSLATALRGTVSAFYNPELETIVRWLPGETFDAAQADENMSHEAMDSWYYYHALFNVFRFASEGDVMATESFRKSLPFAIRIAQRFNYHWPIFFNLKTLDVIRAEAAPGKGGETDVAGLYALVMIHAHELFGAIEYLHEAEVAMAHMHGLGFNLAYQLNTTGFAAEAALRLWKLTGKKRYLGLADVCLANLLDNMWLWQCDYGRAEYYHTFFGLFPLRDAPYLAPFEELEAHAKFHEYLALGGNDLRPSLRLLIAEFQKYSLDRCWSYYPDALPASTLAEKSRNGRIERALSVPIEDLQDGFAASGQVGQEIYGAGLAFVFTARHYQRLANGYLAYSSYPMFDFAIGEAGGATWRAGGDARLSGELRIVPSADGPPCSVRAWSVAGTGSVPIRGRPSPEGHAVFDIRGGQTIEVSCVELADGAGSGNAELVIGALSSFAADAPS